MNKLFDVYTQAQRQTLQEYGMRREETPYIIRQVDLIGATSWIIYADFDESLADTVIDEQIAYFQSIRHHFEWKYFDGDRPDVRERLRQRGFTVGDAEATLVASMEMFDKVLFEPMQLDVRRVMEPHDIRQALSVPSRVFGGDAPAPEEPAADDDGFWGGFDGKMIRETQEAPDGMSIYAVYMDDQPVSCAWVRYPINSPFASFWGGATLSDYRGRGCYTALVAARVQEARERDRQYVCVDASPMSSPILQKFGFQVVCYSYPCQWSKP